MYFFASLSITLVFYWMPCPNHTTFKSFSPTETPVYKYTKRREQFSVEKLARIVILESVKKSLICTRQPTNTSKNCCFVVDLHALGDPDDIRADDNGVWVRCGSPVTYLSIHETNGTKSIVKRHKLGKFPNHYKLTRVYYRHANSPDFKRIITTSEGIQVHAMY